MLPLFLSPQHLLPLCTSPFRAQGPLRPELTLFSCLRRQQTDCGCRTNNKWHVDKAAVWGSHGTRHRERERRWWREDAEVTNVQTGLTCQISLGAATQAVQPAAVVEHVSCPSAEPSLPPFPQEPDLPVFNQDFGHTPQKPQADAEEFGC